MEARIINGDNKTMKDILQSKTEGSWIYENRKLRERLGIEDEIMKANRYAVKQDAKKKVKEEFKNRMNAEMEGKSKMKYYFIQ